MNQEREALRQDMKLPQYALIGLLQWMHAPATLSF